MRVWFMNNDEIVDQRESHHSEPPEFVEMDILREFGVLY